MWFFGISGIYETYFAWRDWEETSVNTTNNQAKKTTQTSPKYKSTVLKLHQAILWKSIPVHYMVLHMSIFLWELTRSVTSTRLKVMEVRCRTYLKSGSCVVAGCLMTSHYCSRHWDQQMEVEALEYQSASAHVTPCRRRRDDLWWWHLVLLHCCTHVGVS